MATIRLRTKFLLSLILTTTVLMGTVLFIVQNYLGFTRGVRSGEAFGTPSALSSSLICNNSAKPRNPRGCWPIFQIYVP